MMRNSIWILLLLLGLCACNDDNSVFDVAMDELQLKYTPVAGGAMVHYSLPNNRDIFAMNIRYMNWQGRQVLKTCGYSGDSVLLDGFTKAQETTARVTLVNNRNEESEELEFSFSTQVSAPWSFFEELEVQPYWGGFRLIYKSPAVVTGMAHVFYLGTNPLTQQADTILINSFPISRGGDTLSFPVQQYREKNTVIVRTEDFQGYRVRQEIYNDIDAFQTEQWPMTVDDFNDNWMSIENPTAKTGVQYLFDGELVGEARFMASTTQNPASQPCTDVFGTYLAGPNAFNQPIILDLRERKVPAWMRIYCIYPMYAITPGPSNWEFELGNVWNSTYEDKLPCRMSVYGHAESSDPNASGWVYLGRLNQDPKATVEADRWTYAWGKIGQYAPQSIEELYEKGPIYVDIQFPARYDTYRYLKIIVHETFWRTGSEINTNENQYISLHELEIHVKKDN